MKTLKSRVEKYETSNMEKVQYNKKVLLKKEKVK